MKNYLFLTAAVAGLTSSPALAEEAGAWVNELVVTANRGVTVSTAGSATRTATPIEEIPQSIQAINRTLIEDQDLRNVGDALVNVSGVSPQGQMELVLQSPKIRGFDSA
ncbi:MAG: TonB-dependent receptor plug domain-containing protein, partial [Phenylobacterium sp.]